jgi:phage shock protein C
VRDWFRRQGLVRPRRGRVLGGVCAAFARRYGWNKWLVRLLAVLSIFIPGPQVLAYVVLWILMPAED